MTNEELDQARSTEALRLACEEGVAGSVSIIAARLAREGWTPPKVIDPDIDMAHAYAKQLLDVPHPLNIDRAYDYFLGAIKQARGLERAQFKPKMVWVKHDGSKKNPLDRRNSWILVNRVQRGFGAYYSSNDATFDWRDVTHYAVITPPEDVA